MTSYLSTWHLSTCPSNIQLSSNLSIYHQSTSIFLFIMYHNKIWETTIMFLVTLRTDDVGILTFILLLITLLINVF